VVRLAEERGCRLDELPLAALRGIDRRITPAVRRALSVEASVRSRRAFGGTAPANVRRMACAARRRYL
jgi:argininosuccinate lyase